MRIIANAGNDRVVDELRAGLGKGARLDLASPVFSLFAFAELRTELEKLAGCRLLLPREGDLDLAGGKGDRGFRNQLQLRWLAQRCGEWLRAKATVRSLPGALPQSLLLTGDGGAITGNCAFCTAGLGLTPGEQFGLVQSSENAAEAAGLHAWFARIWDGQKDGGPPHAIFERLRELGEYQAPALIYHLVLHHLLGGGQVGLDEERVINAATGIRESLIWRKLYKFQRDGVLGALDKLDRFGGCIIADSVGLGKTFEALAIIKYYELRNSRVLVLCPKRLRDNWTLYKSNDQRNFLGADRLNYDVLHHTDLSRDRGMSGDVDLAHVNWGNYDLVVIDESHNFRNKSAHAGHETRYERLMKRILQAGVKTRVLMLSATPVNNRLSDLKNQIAFITEGDDRALRAEGIPSVEATIRQAQLQFNRWLALPEAGRSAERLLEMLGFDYFTLLDLLTIARSRKHIERYYGTAETGRFPERLKPINFRPEVDRAGEFRSIREINNEIRRLNLAVYAPLRYLLEHRKAAYDAKYSTRVRGGEGFFRQVDREESLVHLLRVNVLKRMESAVTSFALTVGRQLADVEATLRRIDDGDEEIEELDIAEVDVDDPRFESLLVGSKVKVLLRDVDLARWRQDLVEDRDRLAALWAAAREVSAARDAKLEALRQVIAGKIRSPLHRSGADGNRKVLVFTAFADTARYLYGELAPWLEAEFGLHAALVTGSGGNQSTVPGLRRDLGSILTAFSPRSKERPAALAQEPEIELLIATDCISEGQNLQDCDYLVNYDIHWNPVRIIQRFGRIDRIGSANDAVQLVNFWPNLALDEYIKLEQRVSGKMKLLDISATGEENIIEEESGDGMNDLEYRRKQLLKLQDAVIDLEDLGGGVSITDLTLGDFRMDLAAYERAHPGRLEAMAPGGCAVVGARDGVPPGIIFCLRAEGEAAKKEVEPGYALTPYYLVHIGDDGAVALPFTQAKTALDRLKLLCAGSDGADAALTAAFDRDTRRGEEMKGPRKHLAAAVAAIEGRDEEQAVASLFTAGGTHAIRGEFAGTNDFEVVAFVVVIAA